ncbi:hypothetical protein UO1_02470 [Enterococcus faecalis EnGen0284]|nr:hypothetical protein UE5_02501 [Enterococcus faecalis EnGen0249]EOJ22131.1 hypothetical protein UO1_02470 [Enterococcus faecalis EnGen0284]DAI60884.1 MAG TPA: hypothetical protein [Caudoviricetes sp.]
MLFLANIFSVEQFYNQVNKIDIKKEKRLKTHFKALKTNR